MVALLFLAAVIALKVGERMANREYRLRHEGKKGRPASRRWLRTLRPSQLPFARPAGKAVAARRASLVNGAARKPSVRAARMSSLSVVGRGRYSVCPGEAI
jgi:hypothetical protein